MSETRISELPAASATAVTDLLVLSQGSVGPGTGDSRKATVAQLAPSVLNSVQEPNWFSDGTGVSAGLAWVSDFSAAKIVRAGGTIGFSAASRASDVGAIGTTQISIPFVGIAVMDRAGGGPPYWTSYGAYLEGRVEAASIAAGNVFGMEIEAINFSNASDPVGPWRSEILGGANGLRIGSGGDPSSHGRVVYDAQVALDVVNNGAQFFIGLAFRNNAIRGTDGVNGFGDAIALATRHILGWWRNDGIAGERVSYITCTATAPAHSLQFQTSGTFFASAAGKIDFNVAVVASSENGIGVKPAVAGSPPVLETLGLDSNITLVLQPKGTGDVQVRAGQVMLTDAVGNQRAYVKNSITSNTHLSGLEFLDSGPILYGRGATIVGFPMQTTAVNYPTVGNATAGNPVVFAATGADATVDIKLLPKGASGTVQLSVPSTSAATAGGATALPAAPAGYFTLKDAGGTSVKVPFYNS